MNTIKTNAATPPSAAPRWHALSTVLLAALLVSALPTRSHAQAGSVDTSFDPGSGADNTITSVAVQPDGKVLIGGGFTSVNGVARGDIARLNADGSVDSSFNPGSGANNFVNSVALQSDGKVLIGGNVTNVNGVARGDIARLNADGSVDSSFNPGSGANGAGSSITSVAVQPDGKVLLGGFFTSVNGVARINIARLNADGSVDSSFNPGSSADNTLTSVAVQPDGKVLIGGNFTSVNGVARSRVARLNADGSVDTSFDPGSGADNTIFSVAVQPDGRVLIGGGFSSVNGVARSRIARLNVDGSVDSSFNPGSGADREIFSVAVQPDGKVLIGGRFLRVNGVARRSIARLNADGSVDSSFNLSPGADNFVDAVAPQPDGKVLLGGSFTSVNGVARTRIARLNGDPAGGPAPRLANISTRLRVETGDNALIGGFIVTGTESKRIIARGIGPSLPFADKLANPTLELRDSSGALVEANDNWMESPNKQAIIDSTIPPSNDLEAAIVQTLSPGNYTATVRGVSDGTGVGLVEVYDLNTAAASKLANISTRGLVQTKDNVLIGGTIVVGQGSQRVIVRAIGPSLPVAGKLADPTVELHDGNGALVRSNDNWKSDQETEIMATTIPPRNDLESALVQTLAPGNYTAIVRGAGDSTGVGLVEVYALN